VLGRALEGRYWLSAFIVGAAILIVAFVMLQRARDDLKDNPLLPKGTIATLRDDKQWAGREVRELKQDLTTNPARPVTRP